MDGGAGGKSGYDALIEITGRVNDFLNASSLLSWDARTMMPKPGAETRGKQLATLDLAARDLLLSDETRRALDAAEDEVAADGNNSVRRTIVAQVREAVDAHRRVPAALIGRKAELGAIGHEIWADARARSDFPSFVPVLEEMVAINREIAEGLGYAEHPYDALIAKFEPNTTKRDLDALFARLKQGLLPLVRAIADKPAPRADFLYRSYPAEAQLAFAKAMSEKVGFDFRRGRFDTTVHPFEISFTRNDVRITTRVSESYLPMCLFGALHESGHGMYEQGVDPAYTRTPIATDLVSLYAVGGVSFGAHESQSRLWENHVGRSRAFWKNHFPELRATFPGQLSDVEDEEFWRAINRSAPSLIRVEADELTYDFHIMLRVELEARMIDGSLAPADLPEAWAEAMQETLGIAVPNDREGALQDVHWSSGQIGTFCNYTIGNVMGAQLFATAKAEDPSIEAGLEAAEYAPLRDWLNDKVCRHGRRYSRDELLERATGRKLDPEPYIAHLTNRFSEVYGL